MDLPNRSTIGFKKSYRGVTFENVSGDICEEDVRAIVSAANNRLAHNNGLANSIVVRGGATIQEESDKIVEENEGVLSAGTAVVTSGGNLKAKYIVHVVSPVWTGGEKREAEKLGEAVINSLKKVSQLEAESVAIPTLSTGMFGFPKELAAEIIVTKTMWYFDNIGQNSSIKAVRFVNMEAETVRIFRAELEKMIKNKTSEMKRNGSVDQTDVSIRSNLAEEEKADDLRNVKLAYEQDDQPKGHEVLETTNVKSEANKEHNLKPSTVDQPPKSLEEIGHTKLNGIENIALEQHAPAANDVHNEASQVSQ